MVHESLLTTTSYASGSHPRRVFSLRYPLTGFFHAKGRWFEAFRKFPRLNQSSQCSGRPGRHPSSLSGHRREALLLQKQARVLVQIACVRTVSEPLRIEADGDPFWAKRRLPKSSFFRKSCQKKETVGPGFCAPKAGMLSDRALKTTWRIHAIRS
jgi:hypothetical protein